MEEQNILESSAIKHIHFVGIGGISMSGLAEILLNSGYKISGSDMKTTSITQRLEKLGAVIYSNHSEDNINNPDLVVYTAAVKENNPEIVRSKKLGIPVIERATLLGQIMRKYPFSLAISGTHGKTTTTSMITMIMIESGLDPTVHIGGELDAIGGNTRIGGNRYFITEACEYVESFLKFYPFLAVILNIELDHVDYFKDIEHIKQAFYKFASLVPQNGYVVACIDDPNTSFLLNKLSCNKVTYGLKSESAQWTARDIVYDKLGCASFTVLKDGDRFADITLKIPGLHNVSNSLAAIAATYTMGCDVNHIKSALNKFDGAHKRFELKGIADDIKVIHDYAHHPSEVKATLQAARNCCSTKVWCVFQPHTYTRTKYFMDEFSKSFRNADKIILADIYAAREPDTGEVHSSMLAEKIKENGQDAVYIAGFQNISQYLEENVSPGDLILTMGAGDVDKVGELFLKDKNIMAAG